MSGKTLSTEKQGDGIALINILFLRRKLDRDAAYYARECGLDKSLDALRDYLTPRYVLPEDLAEANALFSLAPESVRRVLEQPALATKCSCDKLSDEEKAAVRLVWRWRLQPLDEPKRQAEKERSGRRPAVPYAAIALFVVLLALAAVIILPQLSAPTEAARALDLRDQVRQQTADLQRAEPGDLHQQATDVANLRRVIKTLQLPCVDPEDTGLQDALPEIGRYIEEINVKNPDLAKNSPELCQELELLEKEYQALTERFPANGKGPEKKGEKNCE